MTDLRDQLGDAVVLPRANLGTLLRHMRQAAGLTLDDIGRRVHLSRKGICNRELNGIALPAAALIEHLNALGYDVVAVPRAAAHNERRAA